MIFYKILLVLAIFCLGGCEHSADKKHTVDGVSSTKGALADGAWKVAARISSPIDAGREMVRVAESIAKSGDWAVLEKWGAERRESWVLSGVFAYLSAAAAVNGSEHSACDWCAQAEKNSLETTEWRRPLTVKPLSLAEASIFLLPSPSNDMVYAVGQLASWVKEKPDERTWGAAWAGARRGVAMRDEAERAVLFDNVQHWAANLLPWDRLEILAFIAPNVREVGLRNECLKQVESYTAGLTNAPISGGEFEVAVRGAQVCFALGENGRGLSLLKMAETCDSAGQTGDVLTPWIVLAEGYRASGDGGRARSLLLQGVVRAEKRSGINRDAALARTLAAMAASGMEWEKETLLSVLENAQ